MANEERLLNERNVWLATTRPNGKPHLIPIWFVWVNERFYICTSEHSVKVRNLRANPRASVSLEDGNHPVIAECSVRFVQTPFPEEVVAAFQRKFDWNIATDRDYSCLLELTPKKWLQWESD
jgi:uncharacterized pyridoxamine 5'-phosphate oxidase family protein